MGLPNLQDYVFGGRVFIYPEGDVVAVAGSGGVGAAGRNRKPGALDPLWIDAGNVVDGDADQDDGSPIERWGHVPGRLALLDEKSIKPKLTIKVQVDEISPYAVEILFRTLRLTNASGQFNPLEGTTKRAWVKLQLYDDSDVARLIMDVFCRVKITGGIKLAGGELAKAQFDFLTLHSIYNTATIP